MAHNHQIAAQAIDIYGLLETFVDEVQQTVKQEIKNLNAKPKKELLSPAEVSEEYGMTESYWRKQIFYRTIPIVKMGKSVRLRRQDVEQFIEDNKIEE